jgi:hypothetical protein
VLVAALGVATWWLGQRLGRAAPPRVAPPPPARAAPPEDR